MVIDLKFINFNKKKLFSQNIFLQFIVWFLALNADRRPVLDDWVAWDLKENEEYVLGLSALRTHIFQSRLLGAGIRIRIGSSSSQ
jgi:hypothetical protein